MHDEGSSAAPPPSAVAVRAPLSAAPVDLSAYFTATFASFESRSRIERRDAPVRVAARDVTGSIAPTLSFAERFAAFTAPASRAAARGPRQGAAATAAVRSTGLRIDERTIAPAAPPSFQLASYAPTRDNTLMAPPFEFRAAIRIPPLRQAVTSLVPMANAPFPVDAGASADAGVKGVGINFRRSIRWEKGAYGDPRVLLHIPKGFDPNKPSVMVVFFHGHGATLSRDVLERQQVPQQISEAGANAVLVAPQLAYDARSSNPGKLWEPGAFARLVREAGEQLTRLYGDQRAARTFANMPIIIVAYSGGYLSAASSLERGGLKNRVRGVVLLDALYGELDGFAGWISHNRSGFFVSAYTRSTQRRNAELEQMLSERDVTFATALKPARLEGSITFLSGDQGIRHRDFVNHAWADKPIKDILGRLPEYRL